MSTIINATFDGDVFRPEGPVELQANTVVRLTIEPVVDGPRTGSFLETARSLKLEGPPDWSENLDAYLYDAGAGREA